MIQGLLVVFMIGFLSVLEARAQVTGVNRRDPAVAQPSPRTTPTPRAGAAPRTPARASAPGQDWPKVRFPDGSGSIAVPPGWRITSAQRAAVEMQGPSGEGIAAGITLSVGAPGFSAPGVLSGPYLPPREAYSWVTEFFARQAGASAQVRLVESQPTSALTAGGQAVFLLADQVNQGRRYRAFALVDTVPLSSGFWQYYMTTLLAPVERFPEALPQMVAIWQSWGISQGEMMRRTAQALQTMRETNRIMQSTAEGRRTTQWHQEVTGLTLSGRWVIEDTTNGERLELSAAEINRLFELFPGRYRTVSAAELK